jgi:[ribosomal protein S5]-alanine N-acetyltransferase
MYWRSMAAPEAPSFRTWRSSDVEALVEHANNRKVWLNLKDRFPHPYTKGDAERWIAMNHAHVGRPNNFAIDIGGEAIGGVGVDFRPDIYRLTGSVGYWVGEPFWGRGIGTAAVRFITDYAFGAFELQRLEALVFDWNPASARVLEKAGYTLEGRLRRAGIKDGKMGDFLVFARLRAEAAG